MIKHDHEKRSVVKSQIVFYHEAKNKEVISIRKMRYNYFLFYFSVQETVAFQSCKDAFFVEMKDLCCTRIEKNVHFICNCYVSNVHLISLYTKIVNIKDFHFLFN
ncbi:putative transcriptional regulator MtlR [Trichinella spiralis]|uniref:putative transcriptional regulator MtlR n=1 Tax=Trichinella spiralis TaxID=6334 RepID=UPI0001EFD801|nr:putative transcriptional regulator MtlR [Trichinella spiralis]